VLVGSHVAARDPFGGAAQVQAEVVQLHLSAPRMWRDPKQRPDAQALCDAGLVVSAHAPYLCNPASGDPLVRDKTARSLQATLDEAERCGVRGVVVHAGHAAGGGAMPDALDRWVELARSLASPVPLLIENTASGTTAPGRHLTDITRLFAALRAEDLDVTIGACFDTCHAWAGDPDCAADPSGYVKAFAEAAGGIDLLHVNDSKDEAGAGRDRHENLGAGRIGLDGLAAMIRTAAELDTPAAVVETPSGDEAHRSDIATVRRMLAGL
jgi:deoxyribonuclease-4